MMDHCAMDKRNIKNYIKTEISQEAKYIVGIIDRYINYYAGSIFVILFFSLYIIIIIIII
jgi:hypothetical protein